MTVVEKQSGYLLEELHFAHDALIRAMAALDELTRGPLPTKDCIVEARWNISRASLARRTLWNKIFNHLSRRKCDSTARDLSRLKENDMALLRASSAHVSRWGIDAVMLDWGGYCLASLDIRKKMKAALGAEKRVLYPMLQADNG